jgi:hypothetical protein
VCHGHDEPQNDERDLEKIEEERQAEDRDIDKDEESDLASGNV